jgi:hypothetical protein
VNIAMASDTQINPIGAVATAFDRPGKEPGEGKPFGVGEGGLDRGERG